MAAISDENFAAASADVMHSPTAKSVPLLCKGSDDTPEQDKRGLQISMSSSPMLERIATPQRSSQWHRDPRCAVSDVEPPGTLEAYKQAIDSTTEVMQDIDFHNDGAACSGSEWKDPATGDLLGFSATDEEDFEEAVTDDHVMGFEAEAQDDEEVHVPVQITLEWQQKATGTMMGYALCNDGDKELQIMRELFEEAGADVDASVLQTCDTKERGADGKDGETQLTLQMVSEWEDPATQTLLGYATVKEKNDDPAQEVVESAFLEDSELLPMDEDGDGAIDGSSEWAEVWWKKAFERVDAESGVALAYECDDESEFGEHLVEVPKRPAAVEWEDPATGVVLSYECDEDSDLGEHLEKNVGNDDKVAESTKVEAFGFGYGHGDLAKDSACDTSPTPYKVSRRSKKVQRGVFKHHRGLQLMRRSQHIRRVIKATQLQKTK